MPKTAEQLAASNLSYYGKLRLEKLEDSVLKRVAELMDVEPVDSKLEMVEALLKAKDARKAKKSPLSKERAVNRIQEVVRRGSKEASPVLEPAASPTNDLEEKKPVFKQRHSIQVCAYNCKKMAIKDATFDHMLGMIKTFSTFDVVLVSEVPFEKDKKEEETKGYQLVLLLNHYSPEGVTWKLAISEPSGPGNLETHSVFVRDPIRVLQADTHHKAGETTLDHSPFTILLEDNRFESQDSKLWAFTSVHFPPKTRSRDRDVQINAFLQKYYDSSQFRLSTPLTVKGARDAKQPFVNHVVLGDFNVYLGEEYHLDSRGFAPPLLGELISTSSGDQAYDNVIVSKDTRSRFSIGSEVLELVTPQRKGQEGVSDHNPVFMKFTEAKLTKKGQKV